MSVNQFTGVGNLTRDAEMTHLDSGQSILKFGLAINERYQSKDGEWKDADPLFLDVNLWGKAGEKLAPMLNKGTPVFVSGKLKLESWEDKQSGAKRSKISLTAFAVNVIKYPPKEGRDDQDGSDTQDDVPERGRGKGRGERDGGGRGGRDEGRDAQKSERGNGGRSERGGREEPAGRGRGGRDESYSEGL